MANEEQGGREQDGVLEQELARDNREGREATQALFPTRGCEQEAEGQQEGDRRRGRAEQPDAGEFEAGNQRQGRQDLHRANQIGSALNAGDAVKPAGERAGCDEAFNRAGLIGGELHRTDPAENAGNGKTKAVLAKSGDALGQCRDFFRRAACENGFLC